MVDSWDYQGNLDRAYCLGLIKGQTPTEELSPIISFQYLGNSEMLDENSRRIDPVTASLLKMMQSEEGLYGELGGGVGRALSDVSVFLEREGVNRRLVNISAAPIDPFTRLRVPEGHELDSTHRNIFGSLAFALADKMMMRAQPFESDFERCTIAKLVELQNLTRSRLFETTQDPFIHDQRIGIFPDRVDLTGLDGKFAILYDNCGAFSYSSLQNLEGAAKTVNRILAPNGVLFVSSLMKHFNIEEAKDLMKYFEKGDVIFSTSESCDSCNSILLMRKDNIILKYLQERFPDIFNGESVVENPNLDAIYSELYHQGNKLLGAIPPPVVEEDEEVSD